jgi:2-succinyl-5-enolpyruvyl-6-hydroxy-3-cyclohexene-1-carboxylate synthase
MTNNSTSLARVVVRQIIESGISDVVISPGSRNAPLSLAFFAAAQEKLIRIHVRIDERTAAFFALGLIKSTGRPVPIVCTSGTAVANYHPAVLEAHHSNLPLLVLTADRPAMLRKTGQIKLLSKHASLVKRFAILQILMDLFFQWNCL